MLDARDPLGTRSRHLESHLKKDAKHKHMILLLNKCDLVSILPPSMLILSEGTQLAFQASLCKSIGTSTKRA